MSNESAHESSVATYVIVALVLGVITYVEFAIVEYEIAWLSSFWILFWLVLLSVAKFIMVIMFFMHLKDDDNLYTGFFGSGMLFALGTFVVLALLFTLPASFRYFRAETAALAPPAAAAHAEDDGHGEAALSDEIRELIVTDGYSRPLVDISEMPRPKNLQVTLQGPAVSEELGFTLAEAPPLFTSEGADEAPVQDAQEDDAPAEEAPADELADDPADEDAPAEDEPEAAQADDAQADDAQADDDAQEEAPADGEAAAAQDEAEPAEEEAAATWDEELGEQVYTSNCTSCHQAQGAGIPGAFPPLAEHMPVLYNAEGGASYLIDVMLYGLQGEITALGQSYNGVMPGWQQLSDEQIAAVLNHELTSWGNRDQLESFSPITAEDVAEQRGQSLTAQQVLEQREALALP